MNASAGDRCPCRLSFPTAPYLDLLCNRPPGHAGMHATVVKVRTLTAPYDEVRPSPMEPDPRKGSATTFMEWAQEVATDLPPAGAEGLG